MKKNIAKIAQIAVLSGSITVIGLGSAMAADSTSLGTTGPSSYNSVSVNESNNSEVLNSNTLVVTNFTAQSSSTGDANVSGNTIAGSGSTGNALNNSVTQTTVSISNGEGQLLGGGGMGGGSGSGAIGAGSGASSPISGGGMGGGAGQIVYGGRGAGLLPVTGPSDVVDVSALRALYKPTSTVTPVGGPLVTGAKNISTSLLVGALLLTGLGTVGSVMYAGKRSERV